MLNYEIDPAILRPQVPSGTELDLWEGRAFTSLVGFFFRKARLFNIMIPYHHTFAEVNLRFYVRRRATEGWRRGVVFIREVVPRRAIAVAANLMYGENYRRLRMSHRIEDGKGPGGLPASVNFSWWLGTTRNELTLNPTRAFAAPENGSFEEFIAEHYWGYSSGRRGSTIEYRVEHPRWRISSDARAVIRCDVAALYGRQFEAALGGPPTSAFLAEGSHVSIYGGARI